MSKVPAPALKLLAQDAEDVGILSAALQDAVLKVGDIHWEPGPRRLTLAVNRYRWEGGERRERVRAAIQIGGVLAVRSRKIRRDARRAVLSLLAISFEPGEAPGGAVILEFAGGADLRAEVECIDMVLADVSRTWTARAEPSHEDEASA